MFNIPAEYTLKIRKFECLPEKYTYNFGKN